MSKISIKVDRTGAKIKVYLREIVNYPLHSWTEVYTDPDLANKAYEAASAADGIHVHDGGVAYTSDLEMYLINHHCRDLNDYNNTPEQIRAKCGR